ncbi:MAG: diguanylate cyclase [Mycobacterium sp.]|uniref:GGDEF domain-containing protein n=1 Tax=Mycolicibacterium poriferae TaxID=39694 RepID=UPI0024BA9CC9|nr:diguanylate cyclase [Mycolicibacterium poriferae]MCK5751141.1 diguanylate cyclase [Mycobacterium sp.]
MSRAPQRWLSWWRQSDQFVRMTWFLRDHGMVRSTQYIMAFVAFSSALVPSSIFLSFGVPALATVLVCAASMSVGLGMTLFWLTRWPTRGQSIVAVSAGVLCIAGWSVAGPGIVVPTLSCTAFAITGAYLAFFHSVKLMTANVVLALATGAALTVRIADDVGWPVALSAFWTLWLLNTAMPIAVRSMAWALTHYVERANTDPLTGLLNRRGFLDEVCRLLDDSAGCTLLVTAMVDLDDFKRVNDVSGHAAGDHILGVVSAVLHTLFPRRSAICRSGGEEFLIALCVDDGQPVDDVGDEICAAVKRRALGVTASVGVATTRPGRLSKRDIERLLARQIAAADAAMYAAKRLGGDRANVAS